MSTEHKANFRVAVAVALLVPFAGVVAGPPPQHDLMFATGFDHPTEHAGGSNFLWWALGFGCNREPYGILKNYADTQVRQHVTEELASMFAVGQRRLSIGIAYGDGLDSGTLIDSGDPGEVAQVMQNLSRFLGDIDSAGFQQVLFRFFPQDANNPADDNYDSDLFEQNWALVQDVHQVLAASPVPYLIDLQVEGMPKGKIIGGYVIPDDRGWSEAIRAMWRRYSDAYGTADTVGFSFQPDRDWTRVKDRTGHMDYIYEGDFPQTLAFDFYGTDSVSEQYEFRMYDKAMRDQGHVQSWIIAETYYNDPMAAAGLSTAIADTGRPVLFLTQWPLNRGATCSDAVSEPPPYDFDIFNLYGY